MGGGGPRATAAGVRVLRGRRSHDRESHRGIACDSETFLLKRLDHGIGNPRRSLSEAQQHAQFAAKLLSLLKQQNFLEKGGELLVPCFHLYTNAVVFPKKTDTSDSPLGVEQIAGLKGRDAVVGRAVLALQNCLGQGEDRSSRRNKVGTIV